MGAPLLPSAVSVIWALEIAARAALLLGAAGLGALALRRGTAAARHRLWALGVVGALALPALGLALHGLRDRLAPLPAQAGFLLPELGVSGLAASPASPPWLSWLAAPWAVGCLWVLGRALRGHLAARRLWSRAEAPSRAAWIDAAAEAADALGVSQVVNLRRSAQIGSPMTLGIGSPRVLLPVEADGWSPERLRAVLLHELGHVRRRDTLIQGLAQLHCALYWFNPLAWIAAARLRIEREHAADDLVLGAGVRPSSYAADLLEVARRLSKDAATQAGAICMADPGGAEARLRRDLDAATPRRPLAPWTRPVAWGLGLVLVAALALTAAPLTGTAQAAVSYGALSAQAPGDAFDRPPPFLTLEASYDLTRVTAEVELHLPELQACYQRRLEERPGLAGEVVIHWVLLPSGEIAEQCLTSDTVEDDALRECVNQLVAMSAFAAPGAEPADITLPLRFSPHP